MDAKKCDEAVDFSTDPKSTNAELDLLAFAKNWKDKQPKCSEVALERVLKINPENIDAAFELGQMYYLDKDNDRRAKELLTKYAEKGKDPEKLESIKGMLVIINRRTK
jgi:thioredoxin-like negative regulator of GroEL